MNKAPTDYFSLKPVRGSSPTASLAADLSQNFHIDQRSLAHKQSEAITTPPPPSSSPGPGNDSMDISPLPHKAPYQVITQIQLQSPTPEATPNNDTEAILIATTILSEIKRVIDNICITKDGKGRKPSACFPIR
ncbi:MAG: hypothetical protein LQ343_003003 [Gyalolechia ehrenbergii]|nr:MAG: hypothetical protein LQ343_003003 [Gyalolechia ehrenbergii]